ncbi:MAG: hypothetical protein K2L07_12275 [Lachnospiraceae bacterium]|nr:hypothetical protein [Lachnospiraceae bacterium]
MDRKKAKRIIKAIAKREGKDENLVREEMKRAITSGYMNADKQKMWVELFGVGHIPDPEEFIMKISGRIGGSMI